MFKPFKGWRLSGRVLNGQEALCLPFDCITPELEKKMRRVPYNSVHLEEPRPNQAAGKKIWQRWKGEGWVAVDRPSLYLLAEHFQGKVRLGVLGYLDLSRHKRIWPHEHCFRRFINLRKKHWRRMRLQLSPVFLVAPDAGGKLEKELRKIHSGFLRKPSSHSMSFAKSIFDRVERRLFVLEDFKTQRRLISLLSRQDGLMIADGHHRTTAALELAREGILRHALAYVTSAKSGAGLLRPHPPIPGRKHAPDSVPPLDEIIRMARRGQRMPRKTTYFWPKIPVGLVYGEAE